jgi:hypothetical protein
MLLTMAQMPTAWSVLTMDQVPPARKLVLLAMAQRL